VALGTATAVVAVALVVATRVTPIPIPSPTATAPVERVPVTSAIAERRRVRALRRPWPRPVASLTPAKDVREFLPPGDWSRLTNTCDQDAPLPAVRSVLRAPGPKVLLLGDSVGCFVGASFDVNQRQDGVVTLNRARIGCPLATPVAARAGGTPAPNLPACIDGEQSAIAAFRPDVSVLMVGGPYVYDADLGDGNWVHACDPTFDAWYEAGARRTIHALAATGASVVVVTIVHPPKIVDIGPGITLPPAYDRDTDCENRALRHAVRAEPGAHLLDLDAYVCPAGRCRDRVDGVELRPDGRHFQGAAANLVAPWILTRVLKQANLQPFG
jgi:hypothetical protein